MSKQLALTNGSGAGGNGAHARARSVRNVRRGKPLRKWQQNFLRSLRKTPNVSVACAMAGVGRTTAYKYREEDELFREKWEEMLEASVDRIEEKAFQVAMAGDSSLISFLLRCHRPQIYRDVQRMELDARLCGVLLLPEKEDKAP
jgi:hypothetical protein